MKKLSAILLILVMLFAFTACGKGSTDATESTGTHEIDWKGLADDEIIGAWEPVDTTSGEYILFTADCKLRVINGTVVYESGIQYGVDGTGVKSAYTESSYLYGQWTYTVADDVLTVTYPQYEDGSAEPTSFEDIVFNAVEYSPITLQADENFVGNDAIVGKWTNAEYADSYEFTEDGYVIYTQDLDDGVYKYTTEIKMTYNFADGNLVVKFFIRSALDNVVIHTRNNAHSIKF